MCGLFGIVTRVGQRPSLDEASADRAAGALGHRGPDGSGVLALGPAVLAHRRLAIIDPTPAGAQPWISACGRHALVYNGELYNDAELRRELSLAHGVVFRTTCDTETVLAALMVWGGAAATRLRGMYALAWVDLERGALTLARDPLGIKPLVYAVREHPREAGQREVLFASEAPALFEGTGLRARACWPVVGAYLSTLRPVLGERTVFEGVRTLRPGEWREFDLLTAGLAERVADHGTGLGIGSGWAAELRSRDAASVVREAVIDGVERHLRSDVPVCAMLSGGLDSTIIAALAARRVGTLHTYAAGAGADDADVVAARAVAGELGTVHTTVLMDEAGFADGWAELIARLGVPVSTPNEVAIHAIARAARADGFKVALSGEGADELFGGYALPLDLSSEHAAGPEGADGGRFQLEANQWVPIAHWRTVLSARASAAAGDGGAVFDQYRSDFAAVAFGAGAARAAGRDELVSAHLRFQRRVNLPNLLGRLDTATMLAGVEGRTPLADAELGALAEALPLDEKYAVPGPGQGPGVLGERRTKLVLRRAFAADVPGFVAARAKQSFPLPFERWLGGAAGRLRESGFARAAFSEGAIAAVCARPEEAWHLLWPMANVAVWGDRWGWAS